MVQSVVWLQIWELNLFAMEIKFLMQNKYNTLVTPHPFLIYIMIVVKH